jgi:hypothetical protein
MYKQKTWFSEIDVMIPKKFLMLLPILALGGCFSSVAKTSSKIPDQCQSHASKADYYYAGMANNGAEQKTNAKLLSILAKIDSHKITIDQVNGNQLDTLYSSNHNQRAVQDIGKKWPIVPATDPGIVAPFQRLRTFGSQGNRYQNSYLQAYIVTTGTSDPATLAKLGSAARELQGFTCLRINVIGLDKAHRLKMSEALSPVADRLHFSSSNYQEWQNLIDTK